MTLIICADNETHRFDDALQTPPPVCLSYAEVIQTPQGLAVGARDVLPYFRGRGVALDAWHAWLTLAAKGEALIVGAETSYDVLTSIVGAYQRSESFGRELFGLFIKAYEANAITDVMLRQKLIDLACGSYRREGGYSLKELARRHTGAQLDKTNPWRVRFGELEWIEPKDYPREAYEYSLDDALETAGVYIAQEGTGRGSRRDQRIQRNFPGRDPLIGSGKEVLEEFHEARAGLVLKNTAAYGLRTDQRGVAEFERQVREEHSRIRDELVVAGLIRREYARDADLLTKYVDDRGLGRFFSRTAPTAKKPEGGYSFAGESMRATGDATLILAADWLKVSRSLQSPDAGVRAQAQSCVDYLVKAGVVRVDESRDTKAAALRQYTAYVHPEHLGLDNGPRECPRSDSWNPYKWDPKKGAFVGDPTHVAGSLECVKLDSESCDASGDPLMQLYAEYSSLGKALSTDLPILQNALSLPIHTFFEIILETGRTSSSGPNIQNIRRLPGIRECFIPRPGWVFVDVDYPSLELHTLAQTCYWNIGYSILGDALKSGKDPHLMMACTILRRSYADLEEHKKDPEVSNARTAGKGVNFGAPGGLGKKTFAVYAYKSYGIRKTEAEAEELIKQYKETWTEMPEYFRWVNSLRSSVSKKITAKDGTEKTESTYNVVQPWSGRLRAGATFCAACNSPFQGLGADVAKVAMWMVFKACYGFSELGTRDPLYGCHIVNFVHDQIIVEAPAARASAAGWRLAELMNAAGAHVMPNTRMIAEPTLANQWSKKAETWYLTKDGGHTDTAYDKKTKEPLPHVVFENGKPVLTPWDLHQACDDYVAKWKKMSDNQRGEILAKKGEPVISTAFTADSVAAYLEKTEWPRWVAGDAMARAGLVAAAGAPVAMAA